MKQVRKYTKEFKQEAVNLALRSPSITHTAKELGIPMPTLYAWIQQLKGKSSASEVKTSGPDVVALLEENRRLHKENVILKEEKEILKKAATYFAQHQK
jgi:transposase